jgi:acyl-coenzyme A thioesterase PaaI-like protein
MAKRQPGGHAEVLALAQSADQEVLAAVRAREHPDCLLCGAGDPLGLELAFAVQADGSVLAAFACRSFLAGYPGMVHGGIVAALLDAAMTNALFARGLVGVTAELTLRFLAPLRLDRPARVRAALIAAQTHSLYCLQAELEQDGQRVARATAKFLGEGPRRAVTLAGESPP